MAIPYKNYVNIKDNCYISYLGFNKEFIVCLNYLLPYIKKEFEGLNIKVILREEYCEKYNGVSMKTINPKEIGFIHEIKCDMKSHPLEDFFQNANIKIPSFCFKEYKNNDSKKCVITTNGLPPNKKINYKKLENKFKNMGFTVFENGGFEDAGLVVGMETEDFYEASFNGIKTILIPSGVGENFFKKLFPNNQILKYEEYII